MSLTVILLAAGYAVRLYPLTEHTPKALLPLGDGVILDDVIRSLNCVEGVRKRMLITNHRFADQFEAWRRSAKLDLEILDDGTTTPENRLGAIGDIELARTQGKATGDLLVVGTDNLFQWSMNEFLKNARRHRPDPSVALGTLPSLELARSFGVVLYDQAGRITQFVEKSPHPPSGTAALCVYYFPETMCPLLSEFLREGHEGDAPGFFLEWLVQRRSVYGVMMSGVWYDIGTPETYRAVQTAWPSNVGRT